MKTRVAPVINRLRTWIPLLWSLVLVACLSGCANRIGTLTNNPWEQVPLPTESTLLAIAFDAEDSQHGWLVGTDATLLESQDGGRSWQTRKIELGEGNYRFTSVSMKGQEGWVTGKPGLLLHTQDGGQTWDRIPLNERFPGNPATVIALGPDQAELTTDLGAIYRTADGGRTWKALVLQALGASRGVSRSAEGHYVAVSTKGNFYSTWAPGQSAWTPHNRQSSRRVQAMGFTPDGQLWMLSRAGELRFSESEASETWTEPRKPEGQTGLLGIGLLDMAYRTPEEVWVVGGSGTLLCSFDGGQSWQRDRAIGSVPANLYSVVFTSPQQGFILGGQGTLLRYVPAAA